MRKPKIRFQGYTEDWEQRKVWELVKEGVLDAPLDGNHGEKHPTSNEYVDEGIPFLMASDVHDGEVDIKSCKFITKERAEQLDKGFARNGDVLLTHKASIGETAILNGLTTEYAMLTPQVTYYRIQNEERLNRKYLYAFFNSLDFQNDLKTKAAQSTRPYIGITAQQNLNIVLPKDVREQERIGTFFYNLDSLITLHQRKCNETKKLKKYMLQKMFPQNGLNFPKIRFKGYTDAWEQRKLGEVCERVTRKNKNGESDLPLTIASQYGLIDQRDFFNKVVAAKDMSNYYLLKKGEFAYNKSYSNGFDYGSIKRLNAYEQGCLSTLYICFGIASDDIESDYLECFFDTLKWYSDITMICAEGARNHGLLNVDTKAFFDEVTIEMPTSKEEQKQISTYLNTLDNLITLHRKKCDELKIMKKFMLQNMFV